MNSPINPYESPGQSDDYLILVWLKRKWQLIKGFALELGRLGLVIGIAMGSAALSTFMERSPLQSFLFLAATALAIAAIGLVISYLIYAPARSRLRDLESRLPSAKQVEIDTDPDADEDEKNDPDGTVYLER